MTIYKFAVLAQAAEQPSKGCVFGRRLARPCALARIAVSREKKKKKKKKKKSIFIKYLKVLLKYFIKY